MHAASGRARAPTAPHLHALRASVCSLPELEEQPSGEQRPQRGSYGRNMTRHGDREKMSFAKDCSAVTIDQAVLKGIASKGDIVPKGLITCAP